MSSESPITLSLIPASTDYERDDPEFLRQVTLLAKELRFAGVELPQVPSSGKGMIVDLAQIVVTGGVGLGAILGAVRTWVLHRGHRSVDIEFNDGNVQRSVHLSADNVSEEHLTKLAEEIIAERETHG